MNAHASHPGHVDDHGTGACHEESGLTRMAMSATLHCLTGCAIGEILGLVIGTALGLTTVATVALAVTLAFVFGYALSTLPIVKAGLGFGAALRIVFVADTLSIATMEVVDNAVMAAIPGAMDAGLANPVFWLGMMVALAAAFVVAVPVNRALLARGQGHALTHRYHHGDHAATGARRAIPDLAPATLAAVIVAFMLGGLTVSVAAQLEPGHAGGAESAAAH
jgi:hypothetical protein